MLAIIKHRIHNPPSIKIASKTLEKTPNYSSATIVMDPVFRNSVFEGEITAQDLQGKLKTSFVMGRQIVLTTFNQELIEEISQPMYANYPHELCDRLIKLGAAFLSSDFSDMQYRTREGVQASILYEDQNSRLMGSAPLIDGQFSMKKTELDVNGPDEGLLNLTPEALTEVVHLLEKSREARDRYEVARDRLNQILNRN